MKRKDGIQTLLCLSRVIITDKQKHILLITSDKKNYWMNMYILKVFSVKNLYFSESFTYLSRWEFSKDIFQFQIRANVKVFCSCSVFYCAFSLL